MQEFINKQALLDRLKEELLNQFEQLPAGRFSEAAGAIATCVSMVKSAPVVYCDTERPIKVKDSIFFIPQFEDWDQLIDAVGEEDSIVRWSATFSWTDASSDTKERLSIPAEWCAIRGYSSARYWNDAPSSHVYSTCGFRPALKSLGAGPLVSGQKLQRYALYLNSVEQQVPAGLENEDIPAFKDGQRIEFKEATSPETIITWLYNGRCFVADRVLLRGISFDELERQGFLESSV